MRRPPGGTTPCAPCPVPSARRSRRRSTGCPASRTPALRSSAMTEPITMNGVIHDAARRDLTRLSTARGRPADGARARAAELDRTYTYLHGELTRHHEG